MSERYMTPDEARKVLVDVEEGSPLIIRSHLLRRALETVAGLRVEEEWQIVNPDTNGGKYQTRRRIRLVSEWH